MSEKVLVVPLSYIKDVVTEGPLIIKEDRIKHYRGCLFTGPNRMYYEDRAKAESDESILQIIPYVLLVRGREMFAYQRKSGDPRLQGQWSLGLGGHINPVDGAPGEASYLAAFKRELAEEIGHSAGQFHPLTSIYAIIHDRSQAVGRVHLGIVHLLKFNPGETVSVVEDGIAEARWFHMTDLGMVKEQFESWSRLLIERVFC